jgi:IS5 family transposase
VAQDYRNKYEALSDILDANPALLDLAHRDWCELLSSSDDGRGSRYSSEQLLRALVVMFVENQDYRGAIVRIDTSEFLQHFVRLGVHPTMDFTFLNRAFCTLSPETMAAMNDALKRYALEQEKITSKKQRMDSTVYEIAIHYPTDSSLLWDSFRTLARLIGQTRNDLPELKLDHRFHLRKIKKLYTFISRNAAAKSKKTQREIKKAYRNLINSVRWIHQVGLDVLKKAFRNGYEVPVLRHYLPLVARIIHQADRRVLQGESVPPGTCPIYSWRLKK